MFIKRTGFSLLLLAYLVMLGHAFIPHHHHTGADELVHHHQEAHHHNPAEIPEGDLGAFFTHLIHADIISTQSPVFRFDQCTADVPLFYEAFLDTAFPLGDGIALLHLFKPPPEPFIPSDFFDSRSGFRAPPFPFA